MKRKEFELGGLYRLTVGDIYEEYCLRDIKEELESIHGVKIQRATTENELIFVCKNGLTKVNEQSVNRNLNSHDHYDHYNKYGEESKPGTQNYNFKMSVNLNPQKCSYFVLFSIYFRIERTVYKLENFYLTHSKNCKDEKEANFLKKRRYITSQNGAIAKIVSHKVAKKYYCNNPTSVLNILCDYTGLNIDSLYKDVQENSYKRKLKKKLDNIIADAKKTEINPLHYLTEEYYQNCCAKKESNRMKYPQLSTTSLANDDEYIPYNYKSKDKKMIKWMKRRSKRRYESLKPTFVLPENYNKYEEGVVNRYSRNSKQSMSCVSLYYNSEIDASEIDPTLFSMISHAKNPCFFEEGESRINVNFREDFTDITPYNYDTKISRKLSQLSSISQKSYRYSQIHKEKEKDPKPKRARRNLITF